VEHQEEWRQMVGFPGYEISNKGRARSLNRVINTERGSVNLRGKVLKKGVDAYGYITYCPSINGKNRTVKAHRAVLQAFVGECPDGFQCRHLNGDKQDNRLENLAWGTAKQNRRDQVKHGTEVNGERHHASVLTEEIVLECRRLSSVETVQQLANRFGITKGSMSDAIRGKTWSHLPGAVSPSAHKGSGHRSAKMDAEKVREMRRRHANGESARSLAAAFGIANTPAVKIIKRMSWKHVE
jgi:hypothetical protein